MTKELVQGNQVPVSIDKQTIEDFLFSSGQKLTEPQKKMFINMAVSMGLNPFKREIYCISYGNNFSIVTSYLEYIKRAEHSGKLSGWNVKGNKEVATITIYRKDWTEPFIWEVYFKEFGKDIGVWRNAPEFMLKKVAICQGFRLCFPDEVGGLPYSQEEMEGIGTENTQKAKVIEVPVIEGLPIETSIKSQEQINKINSKLYEQYQKIIAVFNPKNGNNAEKKYTWGELKSDNDYKEGLEYWKQELIKKAIKNIQKAVVIEELDKIYDKAIQYSGDFSFDLTSVCQEYDKQREELNKLKDITNGSYLSPDGTNELPF